MRREFSFNLIAWTNSNITLLNYVASIGVFLGAAIYRWWRPSDNTRRIQVLIRGAIAKNHNYSWRPDKVLSSYAKKLNKLFEIKRFDL